MSNVRQLEREVRVQMLETLRGLLGKLDLILRGRGDPGMFLSKEITRSKWCSRRTSLPVISGRLQRGRRKAGRSVRSWLEQQLRGFPEGGSGKEPACQCR